MSIEIEKNIPIPLFREGSPTEILRKMEVGDSIFLKNGDERQRHIYGSTARNLRLKVLTRMTEGGLRIWRIA